MNERRDSTDAFTVVELLLAVLIIVLLIAILLPALACAREAARTVSCANNERNLGLAIFQYAERHTDRMPTAYENLWNRVALYLGEAPIPGAVEPFRPSEVWRCPRDEFLSDQPPWGKGNQCSYGANADETGAGTLKPEDEAGWSVVIAGERRGAQYSPFRAACKGMTEQVPIKIASVATDTVLLAECWRAKTRNSLFLDKPKMRIRETKGVPKVGSRNSLLLKQYTSAKGVTVSRKSGDLTDAGPFSFLLDFAALGGDAAPVRLENTYHAGRINVLYADAHVEAKLVKDLAAAPGQGKWARMKRLAHIPYWNRNED